MHQSSLKKDIDELMKTRVGIENVNWKSDFATDSKRTERKNQRADEYSIFR